MIGRTAGFNSCAGESGLFKVAPRALAQSLNAGGRATAFRTYGTDSGEPDQLFLGDVTVRGPDYRAPQSPGDEGYSTQPGEFNEEGYYPRVTCTDANPTFPAAIQVIAVSNAAIDTALIGLANGSVWRAAPGTNGKTFEQIIFAHPSSPVTALYFASDNVVYVGWGSGAVGKITSPFANPPVTSFSATPAAGIPIIAFASRYGEVNEVYAATGQAIYATVGGGDVWTDVTGAATPGSLKTNLSQGMEIVGLARDFNHPYLYLAVGHSRFWRSTDASASNVWRSQTPVSGSAWSQFSQGLPAGLPITGVGISPDRALFIATDGRGIWWRRDVASNVGLSDLSPAIGSSDADITTTFTLTWTHPITWRDLNTLDLRLRDGDDIPVWVRFTEGVTSTFSLLDSDRQYPRCRVAR